MLGQLTPEQFNAIRYATDTLSVIVGVDVAYEDPYGLFTTVGHVDRALRALAQKDGEIIAKELDKTFVFQMCINAFDGIQSTAADRSQHMCQSSLTTRPCSATSTICATRALQHRSRSRTLRPHVKPPLAKCSRRPTLPWFGGGGVDRSIECF